MKIASIFISILIISINIYFVTGTLAELDLGSGVMIGIGVAAVVYAIFVAYLALHLYISLGFSRLEKSPFIQKYVIVATMKTPKPKKRIDRY